MALRRIRLGYYAYYRDEKGRQRTISLHTRDLTAAKRLHAQFMETLSAAKTAAALKARHPELFPSAKEREPDAIMREYGLPEYQPRQANRLKLSDMLDATAERRNISDSHKWAWRKFCSGVAPKKYADEITPAIALAYLDKNFGTGNGKTYNNNLAILNVIFKSCLIRAGLDASPFATVPRRMIREVEHFRPLTEDEFRAIDAAAAEPWKTAALISWHTALRKETCFRLAWKHINPCDDPPSITIMPGKTARFGRAVYIPIHPELWARLNELPRPVDLDKPILSQWPQHIDYNGDRTRDYFAALLHALHIEDSAEGKAGFHSLRASFITRCDEAGISRRATRGVAGQTTDDITDLYSHDKETAKQILTLPHVLK